MVRNLSARILALLLTPVVLLSMASPVLAHTPTTSTYSSEGEVLGIVGSLKGKIEGFVTKVWEATPVACVTDSDCLVRNLTVSLLNTETMILIGVPFTELTDEKIAMMKNGTWTAGLGFAAAAAIDQAYINPPGLRELHFASHIKNELSDNILSSRAYATAGENLLTPIADAWEGVRRIAYGFFLLIMLGIGFMIMFRKQLPGGVYVSFANALPRILFSLFLITFSFSIVALIFDVVGVFGSNMLFNALPSPGAAEEITIEGGLIGTVMGPGAAEIVGQAIAATFDSFDLAAASAEQALLALFVFGLLMTALVIAFVAAVVMLIFVMAKLLIKTVLAPIVILLGSLPGQEGSVTQFGMGLVADCAAFPAMALMFKITQLFLTSTMNLTNLQVQGIGETAALIGVGVLNVVLAICFMVMTVAAPAFVKKAISGVTAKK